MSSRPGCCCWYHCFIIIRRLSSWFGISGNVHNQLPYLSFRSFSDSIDGYLFAISPISYGIHQGFVSRPIHFNLYTTSLCTLIDQYSLSHFFVAFFYDTKLFISFVILSKKTFSLRSLNFRALSLISSWMTVHLLTLNSFKTANKFPQKLSKLSNPSFSIPSAIQS